VWFRRLKVRESCKLSTPVSTSSIGVEVTVTKAVEQKAIKGKRFPGIVVTSNLRALLHILILNLDIPPGMSTPTPKFNFNFKLEVRVVA